MAFREDISLEEIVDLPLFSYSGETWVIDSQRSFAEVIPILNQATLLGFDTETKPNFKKGKSNHHRVALLQLADTHRVYLFRLNKIGLPEELVKLLANPAILKIGVAVHEDINALKKLRAFESAGFIDLQTYVRQFGITSMSLKKMAAIILNYRISKNQQLSNWEGESLTPQQISYAATDAWLCSMLYNQLNMSSL